MKRKFNRDWPPESILNPGPDMLWSKKVVFDLHNTIVDWSSRFIEFADGVYGERNSKNVNFYHFQYDPDYSVSPEQFEDAFLAFARRASGGFGDLKPYKGAIEDLQVIKAAGIEIEIWTDVPGASTVIGKHQTVGTGVAQDVTLQLLDKLKVPIDVRKNVRFIRKDRKKYEMATEHIPLIVEDCPEVAVGVASVALAAIVVPQPYNARLFCKNVLRLLHRTELARSVIEFFESLDKAGVLLP